MQYMASDGWKPTPTLNNSWSVYLVAFVGWLVVSKALAIPLAFTGLSGADAVRAATLLAAVCMVFAARRVALHRLITQHEKEIARQNV